MTFIYSPNSTLHSRINHVVHCVGMVEFHACEYNSRVTTCVTPNVRDSNSVIMCVIAACNGIVIIVKYLYCVYVHIG